MQMRIYLPLLFAIFSSSPLAQLTVEDVRKGMESERSKIRTGLYLATGKVRSEDPAKSIDHAGDVKYNVEFDFGSGDFLNVSEEPGFIHFTELPKAKDRVRSLLCISGKNMYYYSQAQRARPWLGIRYATLEPPGFVNKDFIDPRGLGFGANSNIAFQSKMGDKAFFDNPNKSGEIEITQSTPAMAKLTVLLFKDAVRSTIWVDCAHGFTPIRTVVERVRTKKVEQEVATSWKETAGVWLPARYESTLRTLYFPDGVEKVEENLQVQTFTSELDFQWKNINDDAKHIYNEFNLPVPVPTRVLDERVVPAVFR